MGTRVSSKEESSDESLEPPGKRPRRGPELILLIYSTPDSVEYGDPNDVAADQDTVVTAHAIADALGSLRYPVTMSPIRDIDDVARVASPFNPTTTLVFNLCEEIAGRFDGESAVLLPLHDMGFATMGGSPHNLDLCRDKHLTKDFLMSRGIPTAPYQVFNSGDEPVDLPFPVIAKPVLEDSSAGITRESVLFDEGSLRRRVKQLLEMYRQPIMAEMFLDGREFNISVWGNEPPIILPLAETIFGAVEEAHVKVLNFDSKWNPDSFEYHEFTVGCPAVVDSALDRQIRTLALASYRATACQDFARIDMREKDGQLYVLEVNPNPCLAHDGGFVRASHEAGYDYPHMLRQIVEWSWKRARKARRKSNGRSRLPD